MSHTPGPWFVQLANQGARVVAGGPASADIVCSGLAGNRANARLIAAAPDLLRTLQTLLDSRGGSNEPAAAKQARAIIAKATSES